MLDQENDPELDGRWLTSNEQLKNSSKARERILEREKEYSHHMFKELNLLSKTTLYGKGTQEDW